MTMKDVEAIERLMMVMVVHDVRLVRTSDLEIEPFEVIDDDDGGDDGDGLPVFPRVVSDR